MPKLKYTLIDPETDDPIPLTQEQSALVAANCPALAKWAVKKYSRLARCLRDWDEALSVAYDAIVEAARRFDPARHVGFGTYATRYVYHYLQRAAGTSGLIAEPRTTSGYSRPIPMASLDVEVTGGNTSSRYARAKMRRDLLPARPEAEAGGALEGVESAALARALLMLDGHTRHILTRTAVDGESARAVGRELGVSGERVRQIREAGLARLRSLLCYARGEGLRMVRADHQAALATGGAA